MESIFEPIRQVPGPVYLLYLIVLGVVFTALSYIIKRMDGTGNLQLPRPDALDPYEVSYLRSQGMSERTVIETALFSLWQKKIVQVAPSASNASQDTISRTGASVKNLHPVERAVYDALSAPQSASSLFLNSGLRTQVKAILAEIGRKLQNLNLLQSKAFQDKVRGIQFGLILIFSAFAGIKAYLGIINNRPVTYLVFLFVVFVLILFGSMSNTTNITSLGRKYLESLEKQFEWTKSHLDAGAPAAAGFDPVFPIALFGVGILSGYAGYELFNHAMPPMMSYGGSSDWGGGGGSSCSSSSCSSSSCSSSSCGGGGCGGCGA
ncbi:MAG: TIGR04222 domain-containing membrane protein [Firmicutes bacterium]|nr:TIGR04222 domain-containing membrane protein [Bacillota bacterium]